VNLKPDGESPSPRHAWIRGWQISTLTHLGALNLVPPLIRTPSRLSGAARRCFSSWTLESPAPPPPRGFLMDQLHSSGGRAPRLTHGEHQTHRSGCVPAPLEPHSEGGCVPLWGFWHRAVPRDPRKVQSCGPTSASSLAEPGTLQS